MNPLYHSHCRIAITYQESDTGSVSSLIGFGGLLFNTFGMLLLPLFPNYFAAVGALYLVFGIFALVLFFAFVRKA
jgi:hypothetical protein